MTGALPEPMVRPARPSDQAGIVELLQLCLGPGTPHRMPEFWQWKHLQNPFGPSSCLVAEAEGRIVGLRAFLRWNWSVGGRTFPAVRAVDTATHPDWRSRGIFSRLTRQSMEALVREPVGFVFNTPNRISYPGYVKMGWRLVDHVPLLARPRLRLLSRVAGARCDASDLAPLHTLDELFRQPWLESLLSQTVEAGQDLRYRTPRTPEYLRWRYREIPGYQYRAWWNAEAGLPAVVICRSRVRRGLREVSLSELLLGEQAPNTDAARGLLRQLTRIIDADYFVATAASGTAERKLLRGAGFWPLPGAGPRFVVRPIGSTHEGPDPLRPESWRRSIGDLEIF